MYAGFPGSAHDNRVFIQSGLANKFNTQKEEFFPPGNYHIIGDSAFVVSPYMLVPFKNYGALHPKERNYNKKLSKTRVVIENAFGLLKGRFRRLKYIDSNIENWYKIVVAACVLYNICLDFPSNNLDEVNDDDDNGDVDEEDDLFNNLLPQNETGGVSYRRFICHMLKM